MHCTYSVAQLSSRVSVSIGPPSAVQTGQRTKRKTLALSWCKCRVGLLSGAAVQEMCGVEGDGSADTLGIFLKMAMQKILHTNAQSIGYRLHNMRILSSHNAWSSCPRDKRARGSRTHCIRVKMSIAIRRALAIQQSGRIEG